MINLEDVIKENVKEHNQTRPLNPDHPPRMFN